MKTYMRKFFFIFTSLILRYPILLLLFILQPFRLFQYIFLVYPGKDKDIDGYCPLWLAKSVLYSGKPAIAGIITRGNIKARGLVLVVPNTTFECIANKQVSVEIMKNLKMIAKIVGAHTIGMAGQGPGIMKKHTIDIGENFMHGTMGTVFSISETIKAALEEIDFSKELKTVVIGKSYISTGLVGFLNKNGYSASEMSVSDDPSLIKEADIVIVITSRGKSFYPFIPYLKNSSIVIDYTHPKMQKKPQNTYFYKVATGIHGVKFIPRLPGYKANWIPGCCIESVIRSECGQTPFANQTLFNEAAKSIGLKPLLVG